MSQKKEKIIMLVDGSGSFIDSRHKNANEKNGFQVAMACAFLLLNDNKKNRELLIWGQPKKEDVLSQHSKASYFSKNFFHAGVSEMYLNSFAGGGPSYLLPALEKMNENLEEDEQAHLIIIGDGDFMELQVGDPLYNSDFYYDVWGLTQGDVLSVTCLKLEEEHSSKNYRDLCAYLNKATGVVAQTELCTAENIDAAIRCHVEQLEGEAKASVDLSAPVLEAEDEAPSDVGQELAALRTAFEQGLATLEKLENRVSGDAQNPKPVGGATDKKNTL